jgi:chromosomal replication initiation ATPase DnaA
MESEALWKTALAHIELSISKANFVTWFKNTSILERTDTEVTIAVPNGFAKEWLENKYNHYIIQALQSVILQFEKFAASLVRQTREGLDRLQNSTLFGQILTLFKEKVLILSEKRLSSNQVSKQRQLTKEIRVFFTKATSTIVIPLITSLWLKTMSLLEQPAWQ